MFGFMRVVLLFIFIIMLNLIHLHRSLFKHGASPSSMSMLFKERKKVSGTTMASCLSVTSPFSSTTAMDSCSDSKTRPDFYQNVVVMRHGERLDNFDPLWKATAASPWDPPLFEQGHVRAFSTGLKLRKSLRDPIHRVFVSPFLRCVQTAAQVVYALCAVEDEPHAPTGNGIPYDPSKVKVSLEYGLCEMLNKRATRLDVAPNNGDWGFKLPELEAMLPAGTLDANVHPVYQKLPQWEESALDARSRYAKVLKDLADMYPTENLLLVTHGEGVAVSISTSKKDATVYEADYCAYSELRRPVFRVDQSFTAGSFDLLTKSGQTGVTYSTISTSLGDDIG